jgi:23S rRNA pseudouridine955/2504/2580 synthase/23S rRNA pseudouridine1911/1915/1917 synthase
MNRKLKWRLESSGSEIVSEDDQILVLNKPSGLLILPDRFRHELPNLYGILQEELGKIFVVHRIDKETSGIIVFAKTAEAHAAMSAQFENRLVEKTYFGIVLGTPASEEGEISLPLEEIPKKPGEMRVNRKSGKEAVTRYKVVERFQGYSFLELSPKTGRMHQIRVHVQALGTPLIGDRLYGDGRGFYLSDVKPGYKSAGDEKPLLDRTALHASSVSLTHPQTGERASYSAALPKDMVSVLRYLMKFKA